MDEEMGSAPTGKTRVLIVDDHRSFAEALTIAIDLNDDIEGVGVASTAAEGIEKVSALGPDVVLMDVHLPDQDGIETTRRIKQARPQSLVLVLTADKDPAVMARAAEAGASGFLVKDTPVAEILDAIRTAGEGGMLLERSMLAAVLDRLRAGGREERPQIVLTQREREVLELMGEGLDPKAIAKRLSISIHTCRGHVKNIMAKLQVHSQLEAVVVAIKRGLLASPPA